MNVTFDVKLTPKDLFTFNMRQSYRGMQGVLSIVLPLLLFVQAGLNYKNVSIGTTYLPVLGEYSFALYLVHCYIINFFLVHIKTDYWFINFAIVTIFSLLLIVISKIILPRSVWGYVGIK